MMSNPFAQSSDDGPEMGENTDTQSEGSGAKVPRSQHFQPLAGEPEIVDPQPESLSLSEWFSVLEATVAEMQATGSTTASAGVSARMRARHPHFNLQRLGFRNFRAFLEAAAEHGGVVVGHTPGINDAVVRTSGTSPAGLASPVLRHIHPALWRAFLDWTPGQLYFFDRLDGSIVDARGASEPASERQVLIRPVSKQEQTDWMREFANEQSNPSTRDALLESLSQNEPVGAFSHLLREHQSVGRRWKRYLKGRVLARVDEWALLHGVDPNTLSVESGASLGSRALPPEVGKREDLLRRRILDSLERMPLSELLRLPVPIEYLLDR